MVIENNLGGLVSSVIWYVRNCKTCAGFDLKYVNSWKLWFLVAGKQLVVLRCRCFDTYVDFRTHILNRFWFIGASVIEITNIANYHNHYNIVYTYVKYILNNWWWHTILKKLIFFHDLVNAWILFWYIYIYLYNFFCFIHLRSLFIVLLWKKTPMMMYIILRRIEHLFLDTDFIGKLRQ